MCFDRYAPGSVPPHQRCFPPWPLHLLAGWFSHMACIHVCVCVVISCVCALDLYLCWVYMCNFMCVHAVQIWGAQSAILFFVWLLGVVVAMSSDHGFELDISDESTPFAQAFMETPKLRDVPRLVYQCMGCPPNFASLVVLNVLGIGYPCLVFLFTS